MATLQTLRNRGPLLIIVVGIALLAFIAGDLTKIFGASSYDNNVGIVGEEEVTAEEYSQAYNEFDLFCKVNGIKLSPSELITIAQEAENKYVGVACGKLDQSCEVYCRKDNLLYMDLRDESYELIPVSPKAKPFKIAVFFSGLERSLAGSAFNMRVDECRSAAYALKAYAGMEYGKFGETNLRDVPVEVFRKFEDRLPEN
jgi:hypothetical protein